MKEITKSKEYTDNIADTYISSALHVGDNSFYRIVFLKHALDPQYFPEVGEEIKFDFKTEALQGITMPISTAVSLAQSILSAADDIAKSKTTE